MISSRSRFGSPSGEACRPSRVATEVWAAAGWSSAARQSAMYSTKAALPAAERARRSLSEAKRDVHTADPVVVPPSQIESLGIVRVVIADLGPNLKHVAQLMGETKRVAGVGGLEPRALALLVPPPFVPKGEEVSPVERIHRVVEQAIGLAQPRDVRPDAAAAPEGPHGADAGSSPQHGVALPHEVAFDLRMEVGVEPVLPGAYQVVEVVVAGGLAVHREPLKPEGVDGIQYQIHRVVVRERHPAHSEHARRLRSLVPWGHIGARVHGTLDGPLLVEHEGDHDARLRIRIVGEQERVRAEVV